MRYDAIDATILVMSAVSFLSTLAPLLKKLVSVYLHRNSAGQKRVVELEVDGQTIEFDVKNPTPTSNAAIGRAISLIQRAHSPI